MDRNLVINTSVTSGGQGVNVAQGIYTSGQTVNQTLVLTPGQQYASPIGFSVLTISVLGGGPVQLTMNLGLTVTTEIVTTQLVIDNACDSFYVTNPSTNTANAGLQLTYAAYTGTNPPLPSIVTSVDGQTGDVIVEAIDNSDSSGTSLITNSGATTGQIVLKTIVAGSGITLSSDSYGNLEITSEGGAVESVNGQTGAVEIYAESNNVSSGASLIVDSGATTGIIKFVTLVAGANTTITQDQYGNLEISSMGGDGEVTSVNGQIGVVTIEALNNNAATGTTLITDSGATDGTIKLKTIVAGSGIALSSDVNGNVEISNIEEYSLPAATTTTLGGVVVTGPGIAVNASGDISNTGVLSVNTRTGAVTLTATDVGLPTNLLSGTGGTLAQQYLPASLLGAVSYQGTWDASTNTPEILTGSASSTNKGYYYVVSVAGTTTVDGTSTWNVGDWIISDGTIWGRLQVSQTISTVNGMTGAVVIEALDNSDASGTSLISSTGATNGLIKLKTLVAGTGITLSSDTYGNLVITGSGYALPAATTTTLGGVIVGSGLSVSGGTISVNATSLVSAGSGISVSSSGVISATLLTVAGVSPVSGNVPLAVANITGAAPLASPTFTGIPTAPTAATTTNDTQVATTAFVQSLISSSTSVTSVNGMTGAVELAVANIAGAAPTASPTFTGRNQYTADSYVVSNLGSITGAQTLNLESASQFIATITGNTTFAFSNPPASGVNQIVLLRLTNAGAHTIVWPAGTLFAAGTAPTFTAAGIDLVGVLYDSVAAAYMVFVIGLKLLT